MEMEDQTNIIQAITGTLNEEGGIRLVALSLEYQFALGVFPVLLCRLLCIELVVKYVYISNHSECRYLIEPPI